MKRDESFTRQCAMVMLRLHTEVRNTEECELDFSCCVHRPIMNSAMPLCRQRRTFRPGHRGRPRLKGLRPYGDVYPDVRVITKVSFCAPPRSKDTMKVVSAAKPNFRKDGDVRWQQRGARPNAKGSPKGERWVIHRLGIPPWERGQLRVSAALHQSPYTCCLKP